MNINKSKHVNLLKKKKEIYNPKITNRHCYVDDFKYNNIKVNNIDSKEIKELKELVCHLELYAKQLEARLQYLERSLAPANIIKATPVMSLIYMDAKCKNRISVIFENWINYMNYIARYNLNGLTIEQCFWTIDRFIFNNYFNYLKINNNKIYSFIPISSNVEHEEARSDFLKSILHKHRDIYNNLKFPVDKEYISTLVSGDNIYIAYFIEELLLFSKNTEEKKNYCNNYNRKNDNHNQDQETKENKDKNNLDENKLSDDNYNSSLNLDVQLQRKLHPTLSLSNSIVNGIDTNSIGVSLSSENLLNLDKRLVTLNSHRILYNVIVDTRLLNTFNSNLYGMGTTSLNITLIIFHAMLHIKCDLQNNNDMSYNNDNNNNHSGTFLSEFVSYTPSVLYGHAMFPHISLDEKFINK